MYRFKLYKWFLILFALPIAAAMAGCKGKEVIGTTAVDFTLEGINGGQVAYSDIKGKPVLLYFFASW